ncbi:DUF3021 domain-containing protein [Sporosarcina sp. ACRSL]|uniref:DUF3021 domain-containing protein n=1 Tax=Sporosarcina sp. ACRSL TaxID=2918215 RepID=UPI001EF5C7FA|nr:DUF3021 domain-containing protein [Sporosarcina sp. ACRSL]MCG7345478.1 DUF3021 domain-containing protein [Sporosarcina sp. ACRSL]
MLKRVLGRMGTGFIIGVFLGQVTQLIISFFLGNGEFMPVSDQFGELFETKLAAVLTQFFLTGLIGLVLALGSFIFEIGRWGLLKQYMTHFFTTGAVWLTVVLLCWMPVTSMGLFILLANFVGAYGLTYWIQLLISRKDIEQINAVLQTKETGGS